LAARPCPPPASKLPPPSLPRAWVRRAEFLWCWGVQHTERAHCSRCPSHVTRGWWGCPSHTGPAPGGPQPAGSSLPSLLSAMGTPKKGSGRGQARAVGSRAGSKESNQDKKPQSGQPKGVGTGLEGAWGHGRGHLISSVLTLWWVYVCGCVHFKTNNKWKANNKEVFGAVWTKDTFVSACHTHTHSHVLATEATHVPCTLTHPVLPAGARVLPTVFSGSMRKLPASVQVSAGPSPPAIGTLACHGSPRAIYQM